jgi:hypothetical protein
MNVGRQFHRANRCGFPAFHRVAASPPNGVHLLHGQVMNGLDAEEWRDLVGAYLDAASAAVVELGGKVAKKLGDGADGAVRLSGGATGLTRANAPSKRRCVLRNGSTQRRMNCAPQRAWHGSGVIRASGRRLASCSLRSTAGLLKGRMTKPLSWKRARFFLSSAPLWS